MDTISKKFAQAMLPQTGESALLAGVLFSPGATGSKESKMKEELERLWKVFFFFFPFLPFLSFSFFLCFMFQLRQQHEVKFLLLALAASSAGIKTETAQSMQPNSILS